MSGKVMKKLAKPMLFAAAFMDCIDPPIPMEPDFRIVNELNSMF